MKPNLQPSAEALEPAFNEANCKKLGIDALHIIYPDETDERAVAIAKSVCDNCITIDACRERGKYEPHGVWAGMTATERSNLHRKIGRIHRGRRNST